LGKKEKAVSRIDDPNFRAGYLLGREPSRAFFCPSDVHDVEAFTEGFKLARITLDMREPPAKKSKKQIRKIATAGACAVAIVAIGVMVLFAA
jgi:hypothetical protein